MKFVNLINYFRLNSSSKLNYNVLTIKITQLDTKDFQFEPNLSYFSSLYLCLFFKSLKNTIMKMRNNKIYYKIILFY